MKHTITTAGSTLDDLEAAIGQLKLVGLPGSAEVRVKVAFGVSPDGAPAKSVTASTDKKTAQK